MHDSIVEALQEQITRLQELLVKAQSAQPYVDALNNVAASIRLVASAITPAPNPYRVKVIPTQEVDNMIQFRVQLPTLPPEPNDIASGELTVKIGEADPTVIPTTKTQTEVTGLGAAQGVEVTVSFVYIDDAGNRSAVPSTASLVLTDTFAPADPGALAIEATGEVTGLGEPV